MPRSSRAEELSALIKTRRTGLVRSARLLTAGGTHIAEDLVQTALARLYVAWPEVRQASTESAYVVAQAPVSLGWDRAELAKLRGGSRPHIQVGYGVGRPR